MYMFIHVFNLCGISIVLIVIYLFSHFIIFNVFNNNILPTVYNPITGQEIKV